MTEAMKKAIMKDDRVVTIVRDGDTFHYKTHIGDVDVDFKEKIGEQSEWEDKEKKPIVHVKVSTTPCRVMYTRVSPLHPNYI